VTSRQTYLLAGLVLVGAVARFATLDLQSLHHDEAVTAGRVLDGGFGAAMDQVVEGERSPPLFYALAWPWTQLFGLGEVGLRSLSALIGTLMIPAAFVLGRELGSTRTGLIGAALVALNPILVWYSQEARSYILMALLVTLAMIYFARGMRRPEPRSLAFWAVLSALALCSHYFAIFLIAPQAVLLLLASRNRAVIAACGGLGAVVLALGLVALGQQGEDRRDGFTELSVASRVAEVGVDYVAGEEPDPLSGSARVDAVQAGAGLAGLVLFVAAVVLLNRGSPQAREAGLWMGAILVCALGLPALAALIGLDFLKPRNVMAGVVPLLMIGALGFSSERAGRAGLIGAIGTSALFAASLIAINVSAEMQRADWRSAADAAAAPAGTRLIAVPQNGDDPLLYYLDATRFVGPVAREGAVVEEIVAVRTTSEINPPPEGFELVSTERVPPLFTVSTFRASGPERVERADAVSLLRERATVLLDE
jgi:mannosyltransferase